MPAPVAVAPVAPAAPNAPTQTANTPAPAAPAEAAAPEQFFEVKVNGQMKKYSKAEAERMLSKAGFADELIHQGKTAMKTLAELKAEREEREKIWDDDEKLEAELEKRGKLDALARKRLARKLAETEMTPEQREIAERDAKIADLEKKAKQADEDQQKRQLAENSKRIQARVESELDAAWKRADFARGPDEFYAVYKVMQEWKEIGLLPKGDDFSAIHADRIVEAARAKVDEGFDQLRKARTKGLKGQALEDALGKEVADELIRHRVEVARGGGPKKAAPPSAPKAEEEKKWISPQEAMRNMRGA